MLIHMFMPMFTRVSSPMFTPIFTQAFQEAVSLKASSLSSRSHQGLRSLLRRIYARLRRSNNLASNIWWVEY